VSVPENVQAYPDKEQKLVLVKAKEPPKLEHFRIYYKTWGFDGCLRPNLVAETMGDKIACAAFIAPAHSREKDQFKFKLVTGQDP